MHVAPRIVDLIAASVPPNVAKPRRLPDDVDWDHATPIERLVAARLFGAAADRTAIAAAWDEAKANRVTMRMLLALLADGPLKRRGIAKLEYCNRNE